MIQEDYVTFEQAKLLKEKGFPQKGIAFLLWYDENANLHSSFLGSDEEKKYIRPSLYLVAKWLREVHNIDIDIGTNKGFSYKHYDCYIHEIRDFVMGPDDYPIAFNSYQEALSAGINKALELI